MTPEGAFVSGVSGHRVEDALGLSNVHVNRVLQTMRGNGLITLRSNTLVIEAWDELIHVSEFDPMYLHLEKQAAG
ncbi:helix-turn-helix domain-containing protein [Methylobacterium nigriterrae]|uniref:helix-turn-helix domain-containing protein n=1 Tax=Methylobacterium nigriterrae TaxID=3127512 RepID=UPI003013AA1B